MDRDKAYDSRILNLINNGEIKIDEKNGIIYGKRKTIYGASIPIGYFDKFGRCKFTFMDKAKSIIFPLNRAIYLKVYHTITENLEVYNIDGDLKNNRIDNLGLRKNTKKRERVNAWSGNELSFLKKNYNKLSLDKLAEKLAKRSVKAVRHKLALLKLKKDFNKKIWTKEDDKKLESLYITKDLSISEMAKIMNKSPESIRLRANRTLNTFRSDVHLQDNFRGKNVYTSLRAKKIRGSLYVRCCICGYDNTYVEFHHIDGNRKNNNLSNMCSLCPTHHAEVDAGEHRDKQLYLIWARKYSDGSLGKMQDNKDNVISRSNK